MKNDMPFAFGNSRCLTWALGLSLLAGPALAQDTTKKTDDTVTMQAFSVTGSYLPPAANSVAIPVISVDSKAIDDSGNATNLLDVLRKVVPQFSGNTNLGGANGNISNNTTYGGSQLSLRNAATLVLINGRRMAYAPVDATGGYQFVDVNLIPVAAIEKVEILADGASAIYGTDAVAGVVNIILKSDYEGFESGGRYGWSTDKGHYAERSAYVVGGTNNGKTSITLSAEWAKTDPIYNYERPFSTPTYGTQSFAGSVSVNGTSPAQFYLLSPTLNAPPATTQQSPAALVAAGVYQGPNSTAQQNVIFNLAQYVTQIIGNQRQAVTLAFDHKITDKISFFGDVLYSETETKEQINGQPITASLAPGSPNDPFNVAVTARNRLVADPRAYLEDTTGIRGVAGFRGQLSDTWFWEAAADYNRITMDYQNPGVINQANLTAAINSGQINLFAYTQAPGAIAASAIVGTATGGFVSGLQSYDATVHGSTFKLPAGTVDLAFGGEIRHESLSAVADPLSQISPVTGALGWNGATTLYPFAVGRTVESIYGEIRIPLLKDLPGAHLLEFTGAVRHEKYNDIQDSPTVPKLEARYLPFNDEFALRGTYSKSFSAPTLFQLFGPINVGFSPSLTFPNFGGGNTVAVQTNQETGSNPNLAPAKSENFTLGTVYSPKGLKGFSISVDYWHIRQSGLIAALNATVSVPDVELKGAASPYAQYVHTGSFTGPTITAPGQISKSDFTNLYVISTKVNLSSVRFDGYDIAAKYTYNADSVGRFDFASNIAVYDHYLTVTIPGTAPEEDVGYSSALNGTIPRWSSYSSIDFTRGNYHVVVGQRYIPTVVDNQDNYNVGSYATYNMEFDYTFGSSVPLLSGAKVGVGVNNVFNRMPPIDPTLYSSLSNADISTYDPIGRFVYFDVKYKF